MDKSRALQIASGQFLREYFPDNSAAMTDGKLCEFIDNNKSRYVLCQDASVILSQIKSLAVTILEVHENAKN